MYADRSYTFITKTPPVPVLLKNAMKLDKGSGTPNRDKVGTIKMSEVMKIAEIKLVDTNASDLDSCARMVAGTARSMGIVVEKD